MKVLVLGGTGAIGMHLIKLLSNSVFDVTVTSRNEYLSTENVKYLQGDAHDINFLTETLNINWDVIVDFMLYTTTSFAERLELLLNATSQYILISSSRVYAATDGLISEKSSRLLDISGDNEYLNTDEYALSKARQEDLLKQTNKKNWTIIRPYITYSENRLQLGVLEKEEWLYRAIKGRTIIFSKEILSKKTTLTYGNDVSKGILSVLGKSAAFGETFHITNSKSNTWFDILEIYLNVLENNLGFKPKVLLLDKIAFLKCKPAKYQIEYDRLYNREFNTSKISEYIDTSEFVKVEDGLKKCLEQFLKQPCFNKIDWNTETIKDKYSKESTPYFEFENNRQYKKYLINRYLQFLKNIKNKLYGN